MRVIQPQQQRHFWLCSILALLVVLCLSTFINAQTVAPASNRHAVTNLPQAPGNVESHTGFLKVRQSRPAIHAYLYYWFVPHAEKAKRSTAPLILWLNGGPGCSSMIGLFLENGPYRITTSSTDPLKLNDHSWHKTANVLYIDNPLNSGFSYTDHTPPSTTPDAMQDLFEALREFYSLFSTYATNPLYLFGESYAGKYLLQLAHINLDKGQPLPIRGLGLGNTWVHPAQLEKQYPDLGYLTGMLSYSEMSQMNAKTIDCIDHVNDMQYETADTQFCTPAYIEMLSASGGFNSYDYRIIGQYKELTALSTYLRRNDVVAAIGVGDRAKYQQCSNAIFDAFEVEFQKPFHTLLPRVLENYRVLAYLGQFDVRCSVLGSLEWMRTVDWPGRAHMDAKPLSTFVDSSIAPTKTYGTLREVGNMSILIAYGSGHLMPMDQPEAAYRMASIFTAGQSLCTSTPDPQNCTRLVCPAKCSMHGTCNTETGLCVCKEGFSGPDCSNATIPAAVGDTFEFEGYMFGKTIHEYRFLFKSKFNTFNTLIELKTLTPTGAIHIFATTAESPTSILLDDNQLQRSNKFMFSNQSDFAIKSLTIDSGTEGGIITLQLWNNVDEEAQYTLSVRPRTISAYMKVVIGLSFLLASISVMVVFLLIFFAFQQIRANSFDKSKYSRLAT